MIHSRIYNYNLEHLPMITQPQTGAESRRTRHAVSLGQMSRYFLRLGALGFGGPVVLAHHMQRDLVEQRHWLTEAEYSDGLALATACPGPLAYQLGVFCGYVRFGIRGALAVAAAFAFAPFLIVTAAAALYVRFAGSWEIKAIFYGVAPVIVALILKACWQLGRKTLKSQWLAWSFAAVAAIITLTFKQELVSLFLMAGLLGSIVFAGSPPQPPPPSPRATASVGAGWLAINGAPLSGTTAKIFAFFLKTGFLVFGSGLVIAPFLKVYIVDQYHWLTDRQFIDAVAIGMISPGPVVITATFVGYVLNGLWGALAATLGMFAPSVLLTIVAAPLLKRYRDNRHLQGFLRGIVAAVVGALLGTGILIATAAIGDLLTAGIAAATLWVILKWSEVPEVAVVSAGAMLGLGGYLWLHPAWL